MANGTNSLIKDLLTFLSALFSKKSNKNPSIDWKNPKAKVSKYFTVGECTYLPSWKCYHYPSDLEKKNLIAQSKKMDLVRELINKPIIIHVWIRPSKLNNPKSQHHGQNYNKFIKGASKSGHLVGKAADFHVKGMACEAAKQKILPKLKEFKLRMENNGTQANWIHVDSKPVIFRRYFKTK